jgi:dTDP-L-rhamnose 4-epimerase
VLDGTPAPAVINVCSGTPVTLVGACETLARAIGTECKPEIVGGFRPGDMRHCLGDNTNFTKLIGRKPCTLAEGAPLSFAEEKKTVCAGS